MTSRQSGNAEAMTGNPLAMYSNSLVGPELTLLGTGRKQTTPA
jgi:hypothetical protein